MAGSTLDSQVIGSKFLVGQYDHDPGATGAVLMSPDGGTTKYILDMRDYDAILVQSRTSVSASSSGVTKLELVAYADSAGAGTAYVVKDSGTVAADAVGDLVKIECIAAEIAQIGSDNGVDLRYVTPRLTCSNSGDEAQVVVIRRALRQYGDLTQATVIS